MLVYVGSWSWKNTRLKIKSLEEIVATSFINEILLSQTNAQLIFLTTCFGENIYNFTENIDKNIIGGGATDHSDLQARLVHLVSFFYVGSADRAFLNWYFTSKRMKT